MNTSLKRTSFTATQDDLNRIEHRRKQLGFPTRSEFLRTAALTFGDEQADPEIISQLARATSYLHQINAAANGHLHLLKPSDRKSLLKQISNALDAVTGLD